MARELENPQAVVDADPPGFYHLIVDGDVAGVGVDGDRAAVAQLAAAFAGSPAHPATV